MTFDSPDDTDNKDDKDNDDERWSKVRPLPSILTISLVFSSPSPYAWSPIQDRGDLNKQTRGDQRSRTFPHMSKDFTQ